MSWLSSSESDSEWDDEESEASFKFEADVAKLQRDTDLNIYKKRHPAWTLGRRDDRALTELCAPGPGTYALPGEQHIKHFSRRSPNPTMAGKPLVLLGVSPGPLDYGTPNVKQVLHGHPKYTIGERREGDGWLAKTPAPNLYKANHNVVRDSVRAFSIYHRPNDYKALQPEPGPAHYHPRMYRKPGCTFGYRLKEVMGTDPAESPAPGEYSPAPVDRSNPSAATWSWARNAERFKGAGKSAPADKKKKKNKNAAPARVGPPRQTRSSMLRATLSSQGSSRPAMSRPGTSDMPARPGTTQSLVYDQVADHVVWPTPETAAKVEDVDILKDKHTGWDRRPSSGKALSRRSLPLTKSHATTNRHSNPYTIYQQYVNSGASAERRRADKQRGRQSMEMYQQFTQMGVGQADDSNAAAVKA
eukprot:jgi/Tetstr1/429225/TSEL_001889.t1